MNSTPRRIQYVFNKKTYILKLDIRLARFSEKVRYVAPEINVFVWNTDKDGRREYYGLSLPLQYIGMSVRPYPYQPLAVHCWPRLLIVTRRTSQSIPAKFGDVGKPCLDLDDHDLCRSMCPVVGHNYNL